MTDEAIATTPLCTFIITGVSAMLMDMVFAHKRLDQSGASHVAGLFVSAIVVGLVIAVIMIAATSRTQGGRTQYAETAGWPTFNSELLQIRFAYPLGWYVREEYISKTVYISTAKDVSRGSLGGDTQLLWITADDQPSQRANEGMLRRGDSKTRQISTAGVTVGDLGNKSVPIRGYTYETNGGVALEGYWENDQGVLLSATNAVGQNEQNQEAMVASLKRILSTVQNL